jgi:hypothetical protein
MKINKDMETNPKAKKLAGEITDYVNSYNLDLGKDLAEALSREHRTLQQSTVRTFLQVIEAFSEPEYRTDGRNEDAKKTAQKLMKGFVKVVAEEQNISEEQVLKNWDVYKPSKYLSFV